MLLQAAVAAAEFTPRQKRKGQFVTAGGVVAVLFRGAAAAWRAFSGGGPSILGGRGRRRTRVACPLTQRLGISSRDNDDESPRSGSGSPSRRPRPQSRPPSKLSPPAQESATKLGLQTDTANVSPGFQSHKNMSSIQTEYKPQGAMRKVCPDACNPIERVLMPAQCKRRLCSSGEKRRGQPAPTSGVTARGAQARPLRRRVQFSTQVGSISL